MARLKMDEKDGGNPFLVVIINPLVRICQFFKD
jgi:hypothetical protein